MAKSINMVDWSEEHARVEKLFLRTRGPVRRPSLGDGSGAIRTPLRVCSLAIQPKGFLCVPCFLPGVVFWLPWAFGLACPRPCCGGWPARFDAVPCKIPRTSVAFFRRERISARSFENRLSGETFALPVEEFLFEFADGSKISSNGLKARVHSTSENLLELDFSDPSGLEVRVVYRLASPAHYLESRSLYGRSGAYPVPGPPNSELAARATALGNASRRPVPYGSHPVFCDTVWAGVEFVVAFNQVGPDGFTLSSRPGRPLVGADWLETHSTVIGVTQGAAFATGFFATSTTSGLHRLGWWPATTRGGLCPPWSPSATTGAHPRVEGGDVRPARGLFRHHHD